MINKENSRILLHVFEGEKALGTLFLTGNTGEIAIGRSKDNQLVIKKGDVSRKHAVLTIIGGTSLFLKDVGSKFGTFINEQKVETGNAYLYHGDCIRLAGKIKIHVEIDQETKTLETVKRPLKYVGIQEAMLLFLPNLIGAWDVEGTLQCKEEGKELLFFHPIEQKPMEPVSAEDISDEDWEMILKINEELNGAPKKEIPKNVPPKKEPVKKEPVLQPGDLIPGYRHIRQLGAGAMGAVYLVEERKTGKVLALKVVLPELAGEQFFVKQFVREAGLQVQLNHPYVAKTYSTGTYKGIPYIIMDYYPEGTIRNFFAAFYQSPQKYEVARQVLLQILSGLDYLHHADVEVTLKDGTKDRFSGIVHRDLKPDNIFFQIHKDGLFEVKIADFGMSKAFEAAGMMGNTLTGQAGGTPPFMPREQVLNYKYCKGEVDVWAAVASIYYLLTGEPPKPFGPGVNPFEVAVSESAVPIRKRDPKVPWKFAKIIDKALADKKLHYKTAAALIKDLEKIKC